jgi:hypothetical protein
MKPRSLTLGQAAARVAGVFGRLATIIVGFVMTMVGLAMTATIVMLPLGVAIGLLGTGILLCGMFAPTVSGERIVRVLTVSIDRLMAMSRRP